MKSNEYWMRWKFSGTKTLFGPLSLSLILLVASSVSFGVPPALAIGAQKGVTASMFGYLLPSELVLNPIMLSTTKVVFWVAALLWLCGLAIPVSSWITVLAFTLLGSLVQESAPFILHKFHLPNMVLFVYALWYHFMWKKLAKSSTSGRFCTTPRYPCWVYFLSLYSIALFYTYSGISKLLTSGLNWTNGISLQLWVLLWGDRDAYLTHLIITNRPVASAALWCTLFVECVALPAIFFRRARILAGAGLISFHLFSEATLQLNFLGNAVLIGLFFLPVSEYSGWTIAESRGE